MKPLDNKMLATVANTLENKLRIQSDLDQLLKWSEINRLQFNTDKCKGLN